jgi:hypothetical protein
MSTGTAQAIPGYSGTFNLGTLDAGPQGNTIIVPNGNFAFEAFFGLSDQDQKTPTPPSLVMVNHLALAPIHLSQQRCERGSKRSSSGNVCEFLDNCAKHKVNRYHRKYC